MKFSIRQMLLATVVVAVAIYSCPPDLFRSAPSSESVGKLKILNMRHLENEKMKRLIDIGSTTHMEQFRAAQFLRVAKEELEDGRNPVVWSNQQQRYVFE